MYNTKQQEDISVSYISAICASAEIDYDRLVHDEDGSDGIMKKRFVLDNGSFYDAQIRIQLKSTCSPSQYSDRGDHIVYKLKAKNYNDLCAFSTTPIILGVLILPENRDSWVEWNIEELLIKGSMYWCDFTGCKKTENEHSVNIHLDKKNIVNKESLLKMLWELAGEV